MIVARTELWRIGNRPPAVKDAMAFFLYCPPAYKDDDAMARELFQGLKRVGFLVVFLVHAQPIYPKLSKKMYWCRRV